MSQEYGLKNIDERRNYFLEEKESKINWWVKSAKRFA